MSITAMKQALEALENASEYIQAEHDRRKEMYEPYGMVHKYSTEAQNLLDNKQAITSLRQAIEQAEKQEPVGQLQEEAYGRGQVMWFNKPADQSMLYTTPQPQQAEKQEPVAYIKTMIDALYENGDPVSVEAAELMEKLYTTPPAAPVQEPEELTIAYMDGYDKGNATAQREWVGLTDENVVDLVDNEDWYNDPEGFVKTVEAKLKEKNT